MKRISDTFSQNEFFDFFFLIERWDEIVGPRNAAHTLPLKNEFKTLVILCNHSVFAQQLALLEREILSQIYKKFPKLSKSINRLKFQYNPAFFESRKALINKRIKKKEIIPQRDHLFSPKRMSLEKQAKELFKDLEDDEVKESLISIYIQKNIDC
ncbi:MAG: DUF721 domain-containing protein [Halobacteriovoraceae bacterium]|nr:DUF721 domain-containing protein [Halobacteriovoraceae bacterium]